MTGTLASRRRLAAFLTWLCLLATGAEASNAEPHAVLLRLARPAAGAPTALAAGDFDEDGRRDLAVAETVGGRSTVVVLAGARPGDPAGFGAELSSTGVPVEATWMAAGDFDADGHLDLAFGARDDESLHWLPGDGAGRLGGLGSLELPGRLTAWASGEVNRRDGLADLVVGVTGARGPLLLVFEGARGALTSEPEVHPLPAPASAIALGRFHEGPWRDVAVAAGADVWVLAGRDRKLSLPAAARAAVPAPSWERLALGRAVESLSAADLVPDALGRAELRVRTKGGRKLVLQRRVPEPTPSAAPGAAPAVRTGRTTPGVRANGRPAGPARTRLAPLSAPGARPSSAHPEWLEVPSRSVRQPLAPEASLTERLRAGDAAQAFVTLPVRLGTDGLPDLIVASRDGLAAIATKAATIFTVNSTNDTDDGTCDGTHCSLREAILAANATADADEIDFSIAGGGPHTIALASALPAITQPVTIDGYSQSGAVENTDATVFDGTLQIVLDGSSLGSGDALSFSGSAAGSVVRGLSLVDFPGSGVVVSSGSVTIEGNLIGLEPDGSTVGPLTGSGVELFSDGNTVGGTAPEARNVISGPQVFAVWIADAADNVVEGNLVGTDAGGSANLGQTTYAGVMVEGANDNTVGGATAGAGNVIAGSGQSGVCLCNFEATPPLSTGNVAQGNRIGTDATGTSAFPNGLDGVASQDASGNTIGGTAAGAGNLLAGNDQNGVFVSHFGIAPADDNVVQGNRIGTDSTGTAALPNANGVYLFESASNDTVGGATAAAANLISGNAYSGVVLNFDDNGGLGVSQNLVAGNLIGTDATGTSPLGNGYTGISLYDTTANTIEDNTVRYNASSGIYLDSFDAPTTDNLTSQNTIADNGGDGVTMYGDVTVRNEVSENELFDNAGLAIELWNGAGTLGPNANDPDDPDTGPDGFQNYPVLDAAAPGGSSLTGTLDSAPNGAFTVELFALASCDPSGYGEADVFLGSAAANTDANGDATFSFPLGGAIAEGDLFSATATDADGNTSELSGCRESCVENKVLPAQTVSGAQTETACETLTAGDGGFTVDGSGDLLLRAGSSVVFKSGFSVGSGGKLEVRIEPRLSTP